jgi:hypothetical protein
VLRAELRHESLSRLAGRLQVPPKALRTILRFGDPSLDEEQWRALDALRQTHPAGEPEPGAVAVSILVAALPKATRVRIRAEFVRQLYESYRGTGTPLPGWIEDELLAERQLARTRGGNVGRAGA